MHVWMCIKYLVKFIMPEPSDNSKLVNVADANQQIRDTASFIFLINLCV